MIPRFSKKLQTHFSELLRFLTRAETTRHKLTQADTIWTQSGYSLDTVWIQSGYNLDTIWTQSGRNLHNTKQFERFKIIFLTTLSLVGPLRASLLTVKNVQVYTFISKELS